jgi:hypothetical protein
MVRGLRSFIAGILGIRDDSARNGDWWEIDLILVILGGSIIAGVTAFLSL